MNTTTIKWLLLVAIVTGMILSLAIQASGAWKTISNVKQLPDSIATTDIKTEQQTYTVKQIVSWHLFGKPSAKKTIPTVTQKYIPKTNLKLSLRGVFTADDSTQASAIIEGPDKRAKFYLTGDTLPGNATLHKVENDNVVLKRANRLETLYFPKPEKNNSTRRTRNTSQPNFSKTTEHINRKRMSVANNAQDKAKNIKREELRKMLEKMQNQSANK